MGTGRKCWYLAAIAAVAFAVGCDSDDGGGGIDVTGWWLVEVRPPGMGTYQPMTLAHLDQVGTTVTVWGDGPVFTLDGNKLTATEYEDGPGSPYQVIDLTATQDSFSGTMTSYAADGTLIEQSDLRASRHAAPTGTLTASAPYNIDSTIAYAAVDYFIGTLMGIEIEHGDATSWFRLCLENFSSMGIGTYSVPSEIEAGIESDADGDWATSGTVVIDSYTADTAIAGSYSITLGGGGTVTGTFDVAIEIVASYP